LAIRPKKMIGSILVLIPVIHENNRYTNYLCCFFPFAKWTQWRTFMIHRLFSQRFDTLNTDSDEASFSSQHNFSWLLLVPDFMFKLVGKQNISPKCTNTLWF
jgi:hypothetical protein